MKAINLILAILVSIASVMAYGGGGSSYVYFKTTENKVTGTTLTHYNIKSNQKELEQSLDNLKFKLNTGGLKYIDFFKTKSNILSFRSSETRTITVTDEFGTKLELQTNKEYTLNEIKTQLVMNRVIISLVKDTQKELFGVQVKGIYDVTTAYGTTRVYLTE